MTVRDIEPPIAEDARPQGAARHLRFLALILLVSAGLRFALILSGGQFFFPDEQRYLAARRAVSFVLSGHPRAALSAVIGRMDHVLFKAVAIFPACIEELVARLSPPLAGALMHDRAVVPACFFAGFSLASIALVWLIARRSGGSYVEADLSALALSLCSTFFYYCRHLVPYDQAVFFSLLAVWVGYGVGRTRYQSVLVGILGGISFLTYLGTFALPAAAVLLHALSGARSIRRVLTRAAVAGGSAVAFVCVFMSTASLALGRNLFATAAAFSHGVTQGDFAEGWTVPFEFLWHAEHGLLLVWIVLLVTLLVGLAASRLAERAALWLLVVAVLYGSLGFFSADLRMFVVYGRVVRTLVPFMCLLTGYLLAAAVRSSKAGRPLAAAVIAAMCVQTAVSFASIFAIDYPRTLAPEAQHLCPGLHLSERVFSYESPSVYDGGGCTLVNFNYLYPVPRLTGTELAGRTLLQRPHPQNFTPYQYEGNSPAQRAAFREMRPVMRVLRADN